MSKFVTLMAALFAALVFACSDDDGAGDSGSAIEIGALLPLTGALASYGETSDAALAEALAAINSGEGAEVSLVTEDTESVPATALERLRALNDRGVKTVIGPYSSSEVLEVGEFANQNGIILLSPLSTAHSLAFADDNVLRFTPDDVEEGVAVANLAWADGVRTLITLTRDDEGNRGLQIAVKEAFEAAGGTVVEGPLYGATESEFSDEVTELESTLAALTTPPGEIGVYLAAFAEVVQLFNATSQSEALSALRWYGSNSVALSRELVADPTAAAFAVETDYPNPILGLRNTDESLWGPVSERVTQAIGRSPDAFALAAYDALITAHAALAQVGSGADAVSLRDAIAAEAEASTGLTGPLLLNAAGDRALASYDFWAVCERSAGVFSWLKVATYAAGQAQRLPEQPSC